MERGKIETGNQSINQLISNVKWGMYSNYLSVPTDCPQRDERQGWTADTQVFAEAGSFLADTYGFFRKFMRDMRDTQTECGSYTGVAPVGCYGNAGDMRLGWSDCGIIVPYVMWRQTGRTEMLAEHWDSMVAFMNFLKAIRDLQKRIGIKPTIRDYVPNEKDFLDRLDAMTEQAFDDQCTGANPRYPLMKEIKQMYLNAYYGKHDIV